MVRYIVKTEVVAKALADFLDRWMIKVEIVPFGDTMKQLNLIEPATHPMWRDLCDAFIAGRDSLSAENAALREEVERLRRPLQAIVDAAEKNEHKEWDQLDDYQGNQDDYARAFAEVSEYQASRSIAALLSAPPQPAKDEVQK